MLRLSIALAVTVACFGCGGSTSPTAKTSSPTQPGKPTVPSPAKGERGGRVTLLKPDNVKAEIVHDKAKNAVQVYLDALKPEDVEKVVFDAKVDVGQVEEYPLKRDGAVWESTDAKLIAKLREGRSAKVTLSVTTKKGSLITFEYLSLE